MSASTTTEPAGDTSGPAHDGALPSCVIVAEHASMLMGGEAAIPWHYFRVLRARGADVHLVVHERVRAELDALVDPGDATRLHYARDTTAHRLLHRIGERMPARLAYFSVGFVMRFLTQVEERRIARELVERYGIDVVHQPIPVSPREPSLMTGLGAPVVIGPMNGGMAYPPGLGGASSTARRQLERLGMIGAGILQRLLAGKRRAALLLVANERTRAALPFRRAEAVELVENGVDLAVWQGPGAADEAQRTGTAEPDDDRTVEFVFLGRLVGWKAVDIVIDALAAVVDDLSDQGVGAHLTIIGDGPERDALERAAADSRSASGAPLSDRIAFMGWQSQERCAEVLGDADVLVLPSLYECGGAVVLEAMAMGKPVIATAWGGPADYLDATCGVLVEPTSRAAIEQGFATAMRELAVDPDRRRDLGAGGRRRVEREFDWEIKVDRMIELYRAAIHIGSRAADRSP